MRREPAPSSFLPSDRTCSSLPCASLPLLLSCCVSSSLLRQGAVLTPASPVRLDSLTSVLPPFHLSQLQVWERLPGPSHPAWVFQPFQPPRHPQSLLPLPVVTNSYLFPLRRLNESNECELLHL
ncbi:Hypothetical predicted protein [Marmota monax]|uniref:Uncharacterized protein n=1 Tax=Marmota monax TaxID=9995 RepID=A0A5E4BG43_MARMO|nr:hypothetical protein GHT09_013528 [Marmota monax]VTJ68664.1 Hypothetical predicted protein [Marmota monax]